MSILRAPDESQGGFPGPEPKELGGLEERIELQLKAPIDFHARPSATIKRICEGYGGRSDKNQIHFRVGDAEWFEIRDPKLPLVKKDDHVTFQVVGPDRSKCAFAIQAAFNDSFRLKSPDYIKMAEAGVYSFVAAPHDDITSADAPLSLFIVGDRYLEGFGAGSGKAVCGNTMKVEGTDYKRKFRLVGKPEIRIEAKRLLTLRRIMGSGRKLANQGDAKAEKRDELQEVLDAEAHYVSDLTRAACRFYGRKEGIKQKELDDAGVMLEAKEGMFPNAELAIELAAGWKDISPAERPELDSIRRTVISNLVDGYNTRDTLGYLVGRLVHPFRNWVGFERAGIHLLDERVPPVLNPICEHKNGFRFITYGKPIPLDAQGDATAYVARNAASTKSPEVVVFDDVSKDPRTNRGYIESKCCGFAPIMNTDGKVLGVIWADNADKRQITKEQQLFLGHMALEAGELLQMSAMVSKTGLPNKGDIAIFKFCPTGDQVIECIERGFDAAVASSGNRKCHGVIMARSRGFPLVVGISETVLDTPDNSVMLVADPSDSRMAVVIPTPSRKTRDNFGIRPDQTISIEVENVNPRPAVTLDGRRVYLRASVNSTDTQRFNRLNKYGAEGIGLLRTEMGMMMDPPGFQLIPGDPESQTRLEEYFFQKYKAVADNLSGSHLEITSKAPIIIRLLDLHEEKCPRIIQEAYGVEEIRRYTGLTFLLRHSNDILKPQARAISRVAAEAKQPIWYMMPNAKDRELVVSTVDFMQKMKSQSAPNATLKAIAQLETPGAVDELGGMLDYIDGIAFGTNDLTVNVRGLRDRQSDTREEFHPQVIRTIKRGVDTIQSARHRRPNLSCIACGTLSETPEGVAVLIGCGVDQFSASSRFIHEIRETVTKLTEKECHEMVDNILAGRVGSSAEEVYSHVNAKIKHHRT